MKQKFLNILIVLVILIGLNLIISNKSYASQSGTIDTCKWDLDDNGVLTVHAGSLDCTSFYSLEIKKQIKEINIIESVICTNGYKLFYNLTNCEKMNLSGLDTSNVTDMSEMFENCSSLISLDLSNFDTSNVTNMRLMFAYCYSLTKLDVSNFNTSNVTKMSYMFNCCYSLETLDLSNFNTSNLGYDYEYDVYAISSMFNNCSSLKSLNISNFDTSNVKCFYGLFENCSSLVTLDLTSFDTSKANNYSCMFSNCTSLEKIYIINPFNKILLFSKDMFYNCLKLVGENGTTYDENNINSLYARIDSNENKGYFSTTYKINIENNECSNDLNDNFKLFGGNSKKVIIKPNVGYKIAKIIDNEKELEVNCIEEYTYTLENVIEDHNIKVETKPIEYKIISGDNQERKEKNTEDLTITSDGLYEIFIELEINGKELIKDKDYTVEKGSTIVTISKEYLDTLDIGDYEIKFKYSNGSEPVGTMKIAKENIIIENNTDNNVNASTSGGVTLYNGGDATNSSNSSSVISKVVNTGDKILQITIPIILIILIINYIQIKYQKKGSHKKKPRIGKK